MVREGYKETELGEIPEEWEVTELGSISVFIGSGITPLGGSKIYQSSGIKFLRSQNIHFSGLKLDDVAFIDDSTHSSMIRTEIQVFDILLNITGASIGRCTFIPHDFGRGNVNQHVCIIRLNEKEAHRYIAYYLSCEFGQRQIDSLQAGLSREGLNFKQVRSLKVSLPPLPEQHRIATLLSTLDECIEKTEALIAKLRSVKAGLMQDLLTRGIDEEGRIRDESTHEFKDTEIGRVPVEWEVRRFSTLATFKNGVNFEKQNQGMGIKIIGVTDFQNYSFPDYNSVQEIDPRGIVRDIDLLQENDFLFVRSNGNIELVGRTLLIKNLKEKIIHSGFTIRARFYSLFDINPMFYSYYFKAAYFRKMVNTLGGGTNISNISQEMLSEFLVLVPSFDEQNRIASILSAADDRISREKQYLKKFHLQKKGLMVDLLTGRVRVDPKISEY